MRRGDAVGVALLVVLVHALLAYGEVAGLRLRLPHVVNAALLATNLYALLALYLLARVRPWGACALFMAGYGLLFAVFFLYNREWQPLFFLYAVFYASVFRLPFAHGLFWIYVAAHTLAQPYPLAAFLTVGAAFSAAYAARRRGAGRLVTALLFGGLLAFGALLYPLLCFASPDSVQTLLRTWQAGDVRGPILTSLLSATLSCLVVVAFGVPLAHALAQSRFPGKPIVEGAIDLPILVPQSAAGVAFLWVLGEKGPLGSVMHIPGTLAGVVLAQVFVSAPFLIKAALTAFEAVDPELEQAARTEGAGELSILGRIALPIASRGIFVGAILAWSRAVSEVGMVAVLSYYPLTAPILVFERSSQAGIDQARPIAVLLVLWCLWVFVGLQFLRSATFARWVRGGAS